jgi:hypothetical protein
MGVWRGTELRGAVAKYFRPGFELRVYFQPDNRFEFHISTFNNSFRPLIVIFLILWQDTLVTHCDALMEKMLDAGFWILDI